MPPIIVEVTTSLSLNSSMLSSVLLLNFSNSANLTCKAMGGPRLLLEWIRNGNNVTSGEMGDDVLTYTITMANGDFGNYTCQATIDDMMMTQSVLVVGMYT